MMQDAGLGMAVLVFSRDFSAGVATVHLHSKMDLNRTDKETKLVESIQ